MVDEHRLCLDDFESGRLNIDDIKGGDTDAIKKIFGGELMVRLVPEAHTPYSGSVWFRDNPDTGKLEIWKERIDSSG
jgi:hypothetical protein